MTQIPQVTDSQLIYVNDINRVAAILLPMLIVVVGGNTCNQNVIYLIFAGTTYDTWIATHLFSVVIAWMAMADSNNRGVELTQPRRVALRGILLRCKWVSNQDNVLASQL